MVKESSTHFFVKIAILLVHLINKLSFQVKVLANKACDRRGARLKRPLYGFLRDEEA
jgi:hypothetical protein